MTDNANLKRRVRSRAAKTGESYTAARRHVVSTDETLPRRVVIATAQSVLRPDPRSRDQLRESGARIQALMGEAAAAGASLAHFPEGALCSPNKRVMSSRGPELVADADWDLVDRAALLAELDAVARSARKLKLWVAVGGIDFAPARSRPTNSLFVISSRGAIVGRYDERMLSRTKSLYMYRAGTRPLVFAVGGVRFGCVLGMESQYPELFGAYERDDANCVLLSTAGNPEFPDVFAVEAAGHAAANSLWVSYAGPVGPHHSPAGVVTPNGAWAARCTTAHHDAMVINEINTSTGEHARTWR
ncbi:MAG: carbon-nitrogen hydrolase family protein, partial [Solirubrobacteraceae bacterium]